MREGRIHTSTILQSELTSERILMSELPPAPEDSGEDPPVPHSAVPPVQLNAAYWRPPSANRRDDGTRDYNTSFVCACLSLLCCLLSLPGFTSGFRAMSKGHPGGKTVMLLNLVGVIVWIGAYVLMGGC